MSKKDYILAVLNKVSGLRSPADNIKQLLETDQLTDAYIEYLYEECVHAINGALQTQNKEQQNSIISKLNTIKATEIKQTEADQQDIENLEKLISTL
ncbi:MAG: hypothetical protein WCO66_00065 [Candidatus Absconditabacteria bacterium]